MFDVAIVGAGAAGYFAAINIKLNAEDAKRETLTKNSLTQAEELKELEFKRAYAYHHQQAALDKQIQQKKQYNFLVCCR